MRGKGREEGWRKEGGIEGGRAEGMREGKREGLIERRKERVTEWSSSYNPWKFAVFVLAPCSMTKEAPFPFLLPYSLISISYNTGVSLSVVLLAELAGIGLAGMLVMMIRRKMAAKPAGYTLLPHQSWTDLGLGSTTEICTDFISFSPTCRSTPGPIVAGNLGNFYPVTEGDLRQLEDPDWEWVFHWL